MDITSPGESTYIKKIFKGLSLSSRTIKNKEFDSCVFEKCIFIECLFDACLFTDCTFSGCSVSAAKPYNSVFMNTVFRDSKVMGCDWTRAKSVRFLAFERCDISYSNFNYMKLPGIKMTECTAREAGFSEAVLAAGVFRKTDFAGSIFSHTDLTGADFRGAINYGIDVGANRLKKAKFSLPEAASLLTGLDIELD